MRGTGGDDVHVTLGFNFKLTNLQAAVGMGQLEKLPARLERIRQTYRIYREELSGVQGIQLLSFDIEAGEQPQWIDALTERRNELDAFLEKNGVGCRRFWFPLHTKRFLRSDLAFPIARAFARKRSGCLPLFKWLMMMCTSPWCASSTLRNGDGSDRRSPGPATDRCQMLSILLPCGTGNQSTYAQILRAIMAEPHEVVVVYDSPDDDSISVIEDSKLSSHAAFESWAGRR